MEHPFYVYMLRCADESYYVGQTDDLERQLAAHRSGQGGAGTRERLPVELVWRRAFPTRKEARAAEAQVKQWNREKKEALVAGDYRSIAELER